MKFKWEDCEPQNAGDKSAAHCRDEERQLVLRAYSGPPRWYIDIAPQSPDRLHLHARGMAKSFEHAQALCEGLAELYLADVKTRLKTNPPGAKR